MPPQGNKQWLQPQKGLGLFLFQEEDAVAKLDRGQIAERSARAREWAGFRRDFLFSQRKLADVLDCARRTIVNVEGGKVVRPHADLLRRFAYLKGKHEMERDRIARGWVA
jgi:DNA-binding XRE family transcriptional regulator